MKKLVTILSMFLISLLFSSVVRANSRYIITNKGIYEVSKGSVLSKGSDGEDDDNDSDSDSGKDEDKEDDKDEEDKEDDKSGKSLETKSVKIEIEKDGDDEFEAEVEDEVEDELEEDEMEIENEGEENEHSVFKIKRTSDSGRIELKIKDGKIELKVRSNDPEELDLLLNEVLESSQTPDLLNILPKDVLKGTKLRIKVEDDKFEIESDAATASTKFPLSIDPATNTLTVETPSGNINVNILPDQAINNLVRNKKIEAVSSTELELNDAQESTEDSLIYTVQGLKTVKLFGKIPVVEKVEIKYGAQSDRVLGESEPWYMKAFGFLFTE